MSALVVAAAAVGLTGCTDPGSAPAPAIVIGSGDDPAMRVMAVIYRDVLAHLGAPVDRTLRTVPDPSTGALLTDVATGKLDLFPGFSGTLLSALDPGSTVTAPDDVYDALNRALPQGVSVGDATLVDNAPRLMVARSLVESSNAASLTDCPAVAGNLPLQAPTAIPPSELDALKKVGCGGSRVIVSADLAAPLAGRAMVLLAGLDAGADNRDLVALTDDGGVLRSQQLVPIFRSAALNQAQFKQVNRVAGELTLADLATMAQQVGAGKDPQPLVDAWLSEHAL